MSNDIMSLPTETNQERIEKAKAIAVSYGGIDGAHHKDWVIDQMIRALTGCPVQELTSFDHNNQRYTYASQGESFEYRKLVAQACDGDDGPNTYSWNTGIAP